jgi:hypothetical protein
MAEALDYSRLYSFQEAADAIGVSLAWTERWVGHAIKSGIVMNLGTKHTPKVTGSDLKRICMKRFAELETELRWRAFERIREREQAALAEEED